jgi:hypothetical protein
MSWCSPSVAPASLVCVRLLRAISAPGLGSARPPTSAPRLGSPPQAEAREREKRNEARRKEQEAASPSHICTMNLRIPATSAPGLGPPLPHLHRDRLTPARMRWGWAHPAHICIGTGAHPPHLHRDWFTRDLHRDWAHPATSATGLVSASPPQPSSCARSAALAVGLAGMACSRLHLEAPIDGCVFGAPPREGDRQSCCQRRVVHARACGRHARRSYSEKSSSSAS